MSTAPTPGEPVSVLVAAAGAAWEADALDRLRTSPGVVPSRRCMDLTDLLAAASTGIATAAVVSVMLPGLDTDSVSALRRCGVAVVVVAEPADLADGDAERVRRMGVSRLLVGSELGDLAQVVATAGPSVVPDSPAGLDEPAAGEPDGEPAAGRVLVVWGPAGAPGRTTVAVGLAGEVARCGTEVLLVDADAYGEAVAQHLGVLDESSGLLAAARAANAALLDRGRLAALCRDVGGGLRVLTGLPRPDRWSEVRTAAFEELLRQAAGLAAYVVVDVGFSLESDPLDPFGSSAPQRNQMTLTALAHADEVVVVGAADPVGLARLARGLVELREVVPDVRPRVVVNRTRPSLGWSDREIHGMVEGFVTPSGMHFLPDDRAAADRALMSGRSLTECGDSALAGALADVAREVVGAAPHRAGRRRRGRAAGRGGPAQAPKSR